MHEEDEELALNAKALGLAIGGAIVAGLLFVWARRDDKKPVAAQVEGAVDTAVVELKHSGREAKKKQKALKKAAEKHAQDATRHAQDFVAHAEAEARAAEREMKAAAWDALQETKAAESRLRTASSRVVGDAAHLASKITQEAKSLTEEGKGRIGQFRHRDDLDFSAQDEIARLREELALLREHSTGGRSPRREFTALASKVTRKTGLEPNSVAADALAAGLDHLERTLKAKAPELLAAKDRRQVSALLQSELGPVLRDSLVQGATAALSSWEAARSASSGLPQSKPQGFMAAFAEAPHQIARVMHRTEPDLETSSASEATESDDDALHASAPSEPDRSDGRTFEERVQTASGSESGEATAASPEDRNLPTTEPHGKAGWLWGAAGLGLAVYALADPARREQFLKLANEATELAQELLRDLQGYDDEFA